MLTLIKYSPYIIGALLLAAGLAYWHHSTVVNTTNSITVTQQKTDNKVEESNYEIRNSINDLSTTYDLMLHNKF